MKLPGLNGRPYHVNLAKYQIDWNHKISIPQFRVARFLYPYWKGHVVLSEFRIPGSRLRLDFCNLTIRTIIEVSPASSHSFNQFFHKDRQRFCNAVHRDLVKGEWAEKHGFAFIELGDDDLDNLSAKWMQEKHGLTL